VAVAVHTTPLLVSPSAGQTMLIGELPKDTVTGLVPPLLSV
jgi:hypothetical protein